MRSEEFFFARGVDGGLLAPLSMLALQQANPTENTMKLTKQFSDYMATQEEPILIYYASSMVLPIHTAMPYIYPRPMPATVPVNTCSWLAEMKSHKIMEPS
jgi:hypothetical protein